MSRVKVFVVRHGEREDESFFHDQKRIWNAKPDPKSTFNQAMALGKINVPEMDTLDPLLTARGHAQAKESFNALVRVLGGRQVAIFCSPLRRAIGTALMAGTIATNESVSWPLPKVTESKYSRDDSIPITVLNTLGDFASRVYDSGGSSVLVPTGSIRCADMAANNGTHTSPFVQSLAEMPSHKVRGTKEATNVRFWKRDTSRSGRKRNTCVPMSRPISPSSKRYVQRESFLDHPLQRSKRGLVPPESPMNAVDDAVRLTIDRGCDTCVIVAHRETIRDMAKRCSYFGKIGTPYCCIGSFDAVCDKNYHVEYNFSNVWAADHFVRKESISPRFLLPPPHNGTSSIMFLIPGYIHQFICTIDSHLTYGNLSPQIWLYAGDEPSNEGTRSSYLSQRIVQGHEVWISYLRSLQGKKPRTEKKINNMIAKVLAQKDIRVLHGWAGWELPSGETYAMRLRVDSRKGADGKISLANFKVFY